MMKENRDYLRLVHRADISITFASGETLKGHTWNISEGGLLVECSGHPTLKEGDVLQIVVLGIQDAVPRIVKVIRIDTGEKIAFEFT